MRHCVRYFLAVSLLAAIVCGERATTPRAVSPRQAAGRQTLVARLARVVAAKLPVDRHALQFETPVRPTSVFPADPCVVVVVVPTLLPVPPPPIA